MSTFLVSVPHEEGSITLAVDVRVVGRPGLNGCAWCGGSLARVKAGAKFCNPNCRMAAWKAAHPSGKADGPDWTESEP